MALNAKSLTIIMLMVEQDCDSNLRNLTGQIRMTVTGRMLICDFIFYCMQLDFVYCIAIGAQKAQISVLKRRR